MNAHDTTVVPSLQDTLCDSNARGHGTHELPPCRQDPDGFDDEPEQSPEEVEAEYQWHMARRAADARFADACHSTGATEGIIPDYSALSARQLSGLIAAYFTRGDEFAEAVVAGAREELVRRSTPLGYREAPCMACGAALFVEVGTGEPLCPSCAAAEVAV